MSCSCNATLNNTGTLGCPSIFAVARMPIFTHDLDATGATFRKAIADIKTLSTFEPMFNVATAPKSRLYPWPLVDNVENTKDDTVYQTLNSGDRVRIKEGARNITMYIPNGDTELLGRLKQAECAGKGVYLIDLDGNFVYSTRGNNDTYAYPIRIAKNTLDVTMMPATYSETQMLKVTFQVELAEKDEYLRYIPADELDWTIDDVYGLVPIFGTVVGSITTTTFTIDVFAKNGTSENVPLTDLVAGDFDLYNVTDSASVSISTCVESTTVEGRYTFTYTAQTSADVLRLTLDKERYSSENALEDVSIAIP